MLNKIDYKGKYFTLQDADYPEDEYGFDCIIGTMTKKEALEPEFVKEHKEYCLYFGIPAYFGKDSELVAVYR